jgi:HJR/Mrr/RecB family endonuclease
MSLNNEIIGEYSERVIRNTEDERAFQISLDQIRQKVLSTHPKTFDDYITVYLKLFKRYYLEKYTELTRVLQEAGYRVTTCDVREVLLDRVLKQPLASFRDIAALDPSVRMREIDRLSGKGFEEFLTWFFVNQEYFVHNTKRGADQGADLIVRKGYMRIAVQAKTGKRKVGNKAVQEVYAAQKHYSCTSALVIASTYFTRPAEVLAASCGVELVDRDRLNEMISSLRL